jgi:hypothetical protein
VSAKLNASDRCSAQDFISGEGRERTVARSVIFTAVTGVNSYNVFESLYPFACSVVGMSRDNYFIFVVGERRWQESLLRVLTMISFKENDGLITFEGTKVKLLSQPAMYVCSSASVPILTTPGTPPLFLLRTNDVSWHLPVVVCRHGSAGGGAAAGKGSLGPGGTVWAVVVSEAGGVVA